jgi:DNA gyrase subunit A
MISRDIFEVNIEDEMKRSYLDYAMSVIVSRALPDVKDGLKPVQRRILYAMRQLGVNPNSAHVKCAKVCGETQGNYHPHGTEVIYPTLVRMAQDFNLRYPLVDGQGNFGSIDADPPAAMRYTEARLAPLATELMADIEKDTVDWTDTYDQTRLEPVVFPAGFPNLLANGSAGIAVGMATNIPPHNLTELINGITYLLDNPDASIAKLMEFVKGPDFPTAGVILGSRGIQQAYETGRGQITMQGEVTIETSEGGRASIVITELPYQVVKKRLIEDIAEHVKAKKLDGITDINDFSDRSGMRVVIELRRDAHPRKILNYLIKHTALRSNFGVIMLALVDRQPRLLNLKQVLEYYIEHREDVVRRRSLWELRRARDRAHILEGLRIAIQFLDEIIALIRSSKNAEEARKEMMRRFGLTQIQADAILAMQLRQLTALERERVEEEFCGLLQRIAFFEDLLSSNEKIRNVIKTELRAIRDKYGDDRRTRIVAMEAEEIGDEDLIPEEETILTITRDGYIKRVPIDTYRSQRRGGRGIIGANTKEEDTVEKLFVATTHDYILFFSNRGRVYRLKAYEVPQTSRQAMGVAIINLINIEPGEIITATVPTRDLKSEEKRYLVMATVQGEVKRIDMAAFQNIRTNGLRAFDLEENDELRWVEITEGDNEIVLVTHNGMSIRFSENDVRSSGRAAGGVRGIMLAAGDRVVGMGIVRPRAELLVATERGHGKRTVLEQYRGQKRGGKGLRTMNITAKTGKIVSTQVVLPEDRVLMISRNGIIIRFRVNEVRSIGRSTQGVRLMNLGSSDELASLERIPNTEEAEKVIAAKPAPPKGSKEKAGKAGKSE